MLKSQLMFTSKVSVQGVKGVTLCFPGIKLFSEILPRSVRGVRSKMGKVHTRQGHVTYVNKDVFLRFETVKIKQKEESKQLAAFVTLLV